MSTVSAVYIGGAGGSARVGVVQTPLALTRAVHGRKANLTVGGAPVFLFPGGGINFMVDVERVKPRFLLLDPFAGCHMSHRVHDDAPGLRANGRTRGSDEAL